MVVNTPAAPVRTWLRRQRHQPARLLRHVTTWFVEDRHADYGFAVMRIASGVFLLGWLLINLPIASRVWGPGSAYLQPYREILGYRFPFDALQHAGPGLFWTWYVVTIVLVLAFLLGWRTRFVTPLLFIAYTALNGQNTPISDGGNYFIRIMLIYLILVDVSRRWSLDSCRRARRGSAETQTGSVLHNVGLCLVVAQICTVYLEAGLYKVQGDLWQNGTAVYYPLQSVAYGVFPTLADLLTHFALPVFIATYVTVLAQIAFPFLLFSTITRRIVLLALLGMHLSIGVLMGLPFFSGIMASADAVLVSGATWVAIVGWLRGTIMGNRLARGAAVRLGALRRGTPRGGASADRLESTGGEGGADGVVVNGGNVAEGTDRDGADHSEDTDRAGAVPRGGNAHRGAAVPRSGDAAHGTAVHRSRGSHRGEPIAASSREAADGENVHTDSATSTSSPGASTAQSGTRA